MSLFRIDCAPDAAVMQEVLKRLSAYNREFMPADGQPFQVLARAEDGSVAGAADGETYWGRLYLDRLFVAPEQRGQGVGRRLMAEVEQVARERGCGGVDLWTMSFQAPGFYEKLGYRLVGEIKGYTGGQVKRYFSKEM